MSSNILLHCETVCEFISATPFSRNGRPEYLRNIPDSDPTMVYTLGQVFVDEQMFQQVPYKSEMLTTSASWYYENETDHLFVHFPEFLRSEFIPSEHKIEITNQRRLFAPHLRRLDHIHIDGFLFERCANNYPTDYWVIAANQVGNVTL